MRLRGQRTVHALMLAAVMVPVNADTESTPSPAQLITSAAETLAAAVWAERAHLEADPRRRDALIDELLLPKFDLRTACRLILRQHWNAAPQPERERFVAAFYRYLRASYGDALPQFRHDTVTVLPDPAPAAGESTRVRTRLRLTDGRLFDVDFYLRLDEQGWRIVDVIVEGISYIRTYRTDFGAEVRSHGLAALILRLEGIAAG